MSGGSIASIGCPLFHFGEHPSDLSLLGTVGMDSLEPSEVEGSERASYCSILPVIDVYSNSSNINSVDEDSIPMPFYNYHLLIFTNNNNKSSRGSGDMRW